MKQTLKKLISWICTAALVLGLIPGAAMAASTGENPVYTGAKGSIDMERSDADSDVSCMTFNVLHYIGGSVQNYGSGDYEIRRNYAVSLIRAYDPDIIGMQEAGNDSAHTENWPADLQTDLGDTYTPILLTDQTSQLSQMYVTNGLIIWYRTSRFTLLDSGAECYWSYSTDCNTTSKDRWYQWAKLYDNVENKTVFVFNTHLSTNHSPSVCSVCTTSAEGAAAGRQQRTNELAALASQIQSLSENYPCFVTGDFNCTMADSLAYKSSTAQRQLLEMSASPHAYLQSALMTSDLQVTSEGKSSIDHIFINTNYLRSRKLVGIQESVDGYIGSDHFPYIAYCDYRAAAQIGPGDYDETAHTYTDTTSSNQYTFSVTPGDGFTYQIYKDTGVKVGDTIWSVKDTSEYEIRFYDASGALYSTVAATIYASSAAKPTLTSTGINQYFANHAYHVIADSSSVTVKPVCSGINTAEIYSDADCTSLISGGAVTGITEGRTTLYLKHNVYKTDGTLNYSEVFPLYIYRETRQVSDPMALYVDENIGDTTGTVAFWDGTDVILTEGQFTGFDSLDDAQPTVNSADGYSIYMAPGEYAGNANSFTKSFSLYGANWDISPNDRVVEGTWTLASRRQETVIDGQLLVSLYGDDVETKTVAVKGITFTGETKEGSIYVIENRGGTGSSYWQANSAYMIELDIQNNLFLGWSTQSSSADINLNCASQKSGLIACNYFSREVGLTASSDTDAYPLTYDRAIYGRNINGLLIDSNRFVNFDQEFVSLTAEIGYGTTLPGYAVYTVQDNRFENCVSTLNRICNITSATLADVRYLGNYFIRCGYGTGAIFVDATETTGTTTNYHYCNVTVMGNKFYECERAFGIFRNGTSLNGYFNAIGLTLTQNVFHNPCERSMQPKNGYSSGTAAENYTYSYQSHNHSTIYFRIANASQTVNGVASAWDLSHNYFYSARLADDFTNPYHPSLYINSYMKEWSNGVVSAEYECLNFTFEDAFIPYYTNHGCVNESSVDSTDSAASSSAVSTVSGITAQSYSGVYDGSPHSIAVTIPEGAFISYSYNDDAATGYKSYSATNPAFTDVGTYTVTYRVIASGCKTTYGSATVTITEHEHSYTAVATAPTCTQQGYTTYTCACNDSYVADYVDALGHGYVNGTCSVCGAADPNYVSLFTLVGSNMVLGSDLDMNFFFNMTDISSTDYYVEITHYDLEEGEKTYTIAYADWSTYGPYYMVTLDGLAARQMADTIEVVVYSGDGTAISEVWTDSIRAYALRSFVSATQTDEGRTLLVDMLNYGAAAQEFFSYNTGDLANSTLTDEQKAYATDTVTVTDQRTKGDNYVGSSLVLKSRIMLTVLFDNLTTDMYAIVSYTDHTGEAVTTRVNGSEFVTYGGYYGVMVDDLVVADGNQMVTVTICTANGAPFAWASDSMNSYAARSMGSYAIYEMVAKFATSAYAYFH